MVESSQQPVTEATQALQSSTVIQRLARRSTEASGIVDVRPFQSELARVPGWIIQRSTLIDQIYKRYNSQDNASAESADLVLAVPSQPVPREQITLPSTEQTAAPSSLAIAKPVTPTSTSQPSLKQSADPSSMAIAKPAAPTITSDSSPEGKFRVTRKAIPLPNIKAGEKQVLSLQGKMSIQSSELSNQSPVVEEIASTLHQFPQPESSLILPKRISETSINQAENPSSLEAQRELTSIPTEYQQIDPSIPTKKQLIVPQIGAIQDRNQQPEPSLFLPIFSPKENSQTSDTGAFNSIILSPTGIAHSSLPDNSTQQDVNQNQLPVAGEIASTLHQFAQSEPSLILPKRISETSTSQAENPGSLEAQRKLTSNEKTLIPIEQLSLPDNSTQQDANQNQLPVAGEIASTLHQFSQSEPSLILPKRISETSTSQAENPSSLEAQRELKSNEKTLIQTEYQQINPSIPTKNQLIVPEIGAIQDRNQQPEPSLILPKRTSETSTSQANNPSLSTNIKREFISGSIIYPQFPQKVGRSGELNPNAVAIAREIPTTTNFVGQQNMIWRKSDSTPSWSKFFSGVTNSNTQTEILRAISSGSDGKGYIARKMSSTSSPTSDGAAETEVTPVQTTKPVREINVAQIAEQVSRILSRQLTVERERRGMNLWY